MRAVLLLLLTGVLGTLQYAWLSHRSGAPDLLLALLTWTVLSSGPMTGLVRAWLIGLVRDALDPGARIFHMLMAVLICCVLQVVGRIVDRRHGAGRFGAGVLASILLALGDITAGGWGALSLGDLVLSAFWTGLAVLVIGYLMQGVPSGLRPVAEREAAW